MVFLGFGKYARADKIYLVEPITDARRGSGSRTLVWIEGVPEPVVASRTERTILHEMGQDAAAPARSSSTRRSTSPSGSPSRRRSGKVDLADLGRRARRLLESTVEARRAAAALLTVLRLSREFFARSVHEVAPALVGAVLLVDGVGGVDRRGRGVRPGRPGEPRLPRAARRATPRCSARPGHAYVYRSYGIHWCLNLVCAEEGRAEAVLVRALEPTHGPRRDARPARASPTRACSARGPAGCARRSAITRDHDGLPLDEPPFELRAAPAPVEVVAGPRIGITRGGRSPLALRPRRLALPQPPALATLARDDERHAEARRGRDARRRDPARRRAPSAAVGDEPADRPASARGRPAARARPAVERPTTLGTVPCIGFASTSRTVSKRPRCEPIAGISPTTTPTRCPGRAGL